MKLTMKYKALLVILATSPLSVPAQIYGELNYVSTTLKSTVSGKSIQSSPAGVSGILGYEVSENLAFEGSLTGGLNSSDVTVNGASQSIPVDEKLNYGYGLYVKPKAKVMDSIEVFARVGYTEGNFTASAQSASISYTKSDWAYGIGASYYLNQRTSLNGSWMRLYDKDGVTSNGLFLGLGYKF